MTVAAVTMVKDEADIIGTTVRNLLGQVDFVIVADNGSTDGTRDILKSLGVTVVDDPEVGYYQSRKVTKLAHMAGLKGATWIVPFDADEVWTSKFGPIRSVLETMVPDHYFAVGADVFDYMPTEHDPMHPTYGPVQRMVWRREAPLPMQKVAVRYRSDLVIRQGNHSAHYDIEPAPLSDGLITVRHYPYRSVEQFVRKVRNGAAAYAATGDDLPSDIGEHWRNWGKFDDEQLAGVFDTWYRRKDPRVVVEIEGQSLPPLVRDPARVW